MIFVFGVLSFAGSVGSCVRLVAQLPMRSCEVLWHGAVILALSLLGPKGFFIVYLFASVLYFVPFREYIAIVVSHVVRYAVVLVVTYVRSLLLSCARSRSRYERKG